MTVLEAIQKTADFFEPKGVDSPRLQAELLLAHVLKLPRMKLYLNFDRALTPAEVDAFRELVRRRGQREPLQHIIGSVCFCGLEIAANRNALIPRPETEVLAQLGWEFLQQHPSAAPTAFDFGTGTGCLPISLAVNCLRAQVWAGDISSEALTLARANAAKHGVQERIQFIVSDGFAGLTPSLTYDSRDTIFTPTRGTYVEATAGFYSEALGGDDEFQRVNFVAMHFLPLHPKWTLGVRADANFSFGDVPFYVRPFVHLRGAPAMKYQGEEVAQVEAELRWQFWRRFSIVGFIGGGAAWNNFERFEKSLAVVTGGTGFRYELARKYGLHIGVDVAFGPDAPAVYVQFGSAWMRP